MKNVETLDKTTGHPCAAASITTKKKNLKVDLGKCVHMYAPFLYLPGAPNSLNSPFTFKQAVLLSTVTLIFHTF